jgi:predicted component of type VI protein secretion system
VTHVTAHKGQRFTAAQVTEELAKTDKGETRESVQRRLSELFNRKQVTRADGRYGVA